MNAIRGDAASGDDEVSEETMALVAQARERVAAGPTPEDLADLLAAPRERITASPEEIRAMFAEAIRATQRVNFLLGALAASVGPGGDEG